MKTRYLVAVMSVLALFGCGGVSESKPGDTNQPGGNSQPGGASDKGGPDSLIGFSWIAPEQTLNGITFLFSFSFDANNVTVSNTCNGSLNATVQAPVLYKYTARVTKGDRKETTKGSDSCIAEMRAGTFDFEIKSGKLHVTYDGQTLIWDPAGSVAGLYGQWQKTAPELGTLKWSMGGGKFRVISECNNGLTASVEVPADFINRVEFPEAKQKEVEDLGLTCTAGINKGSATYTFEGNDLVMDVGGQITRFTRK